MVTRSHWLIALAVALTVGSAIFSDGEETPDAAAQLHDIAATVLGVDAGQLVMDPHPVRRARWNGRDTTEFITFRTAHGQDTPDPQMGRAWVTLVADPVAIKTAGWHMNESPAREAQYLGGEQLELLALDLLRTRFLHFSQDSVLIGTRHSRDHVHFTWVGPGPGDHTHHIRIALSRFDGSPRSLMVSYELPPPPPTTPVRVSQPEAEAIAEKFVREQFNGAAFVVGDMTTSSRLAEWGEPVYPVGISERPLEVWTIGIHASTGEVLLPSK